jgi:hypothetical protein
MDTIYIALVRWGPEWDGQSIYRTKSKALFDQINKANRHTDTYFPDFSEELKAELRARHAEQAIEYPGIISEPLDEEMSITEAMEWLDCYGLEYDKFPVILGGQTELTCSWNR